MFLNYIYVCVCWNLSDAVHYQWFTVSRGKWKSGEQNISSTTLNFIEGRCIHLLLRGIRESNYLTTSPKLKTESSPAKYENYSGALMLGPCAYKLLSLTADIRTILLANRPCTQVIVPPSFFFKPREIDKL